VHEVTSPQAFEGLRLAGRKVWRTGSIVATADHNTPTDHWEEGYDGIADPVSRLQVVTLDANIKAFGAAAYFPFLDKRQGIVHVIGPEQGATLPGMTVVCGDSHTSTHGAFGALAHGIGTSEVEHVLATQTLLAKKAKNLLVNVQGPLARGCTAKDIVLAIIGRIGTAGGTGHTIEFGGSAMRSLSMEGRMTVCNMAIEAGARAGLVAVTRRRSVMSRAAVRAAASASKRCDLATPAGPGAVGTGRRSARREPQVTWAPARRWCCRWPCTRPEGEGRRPRDGMSARWPGAQPNKPWRTFTSTGLHRLVHQQPHRRLAGRHVVNRCITSNVSSRWWFRPPGEGKPSEGLHEVFKAAGFEWREPGCSMCLAMNADRLEPGERCASTSNRNFEGRQGAGGRTHLVSPAMAAAPR
jgi:3-isopropylmalate/(R)-2-methylmalate dehydratase large subunit